jgi:hypothetical protein
MSFCTWFGAIAGATLSHFNVIFFNFTTLKIIKPLTKTIEYFESVLSFDYFLKPLNLLSCTFIGAFGGLLTEMTWSVSFPTLSVFLISYFATSNAVFSNTQNVYCKFCKFITANSRTRENLQDFDKTQYDVIKEDDVVDDLSKDIQTNTDNQNINNLIEKSENFVKSQTSTTEATLGITRRKKNDKNIMF